MPSSSKREGEEGPVSEVEEYRGERIVIRANARCIHSRYCVLNRPDVFVPNADGPWIRPDAQSPDTIAAQVQKCPSGALTFERLDGGTQEIAPAVNTARIWENGPLAFHGDLEINGERMFRATLCRCGHSKTKPYCDHSHVDSHFVATGEPETKSAEPASSTGGALKIVPQTNGCLRIEGALEICVASGRTIARETKTWLCRCGHSSKKPFCDGTHKRVGFAAD
jgi:CDGSH-type Zn-finger protein/uncharacterized Fe-S cluster protein YjdI